MAIVRNTCSKLDMAKVKLVPSMTKTLCKETSSRSKHNFISIYFWIIHTSSVMSFMTMKRWLMCLSPDRMEMQMAVSNLSPVSIQTLIPACRKFSIVWATSYIKISWYILQSVLDPRDPQKLHSSL